MLQESKARPFGFTLAKANMHTLGGLNGVGVRLAVMRAADPKAKDLDTLVKQNGHELPRILACLPVTMCISALRKAGTGIHSSRAALAE